MKVIKLLIKIFRGKMIITPFNSILKKKFRLRNLMELIMVATLFLVLQFSESSAAQCAGPESDLELVKQKASDIIVGIERNNIILRSSSVPIPDTANGLVPIFTTFG